MPKGVMLSHSNLVSNCEAMDVPLPYERLVNPTTNDYQDVVPCFLPFFHAVSEYAYKMQVKYIKSRAKLIPVEIDKFKIL